ncbi:hypothetical protein K440DRAFT_614530 [Wilcoxina mikolae CBS 423.85]|nr:hypothetical protein K440DRAFT_614530 [Wilcoxina mikolae CBS 423.85]
MQRGRVISYPTCQAFDAKRSGVLFGVLYSNYQSTNLSKEGICVFVLAGALSSTKYAECFIDDIAADLPIADETSFHLLGDQWNAVLEPQNADYSALVGPEQIIGLKDTIHTGTMGTWCCDEKTDSTYFITNLGSSQGPYAESGLSFSFVAPYGKTL